MQHHHTKIKLLLALLVLGGTFLISEKTYAATQLTSYTVTGGFEIDLITPSNASNVAFGIFAGTYPTGSYIGGSSNTACDIYNNGYCTLLDRGATTNETNIWIGICNYPSGDSCTSSTDVTYYFVIKTGGNYIQGDGISEDYFNTLTRINTVTPPNASTTSYTTTLGATGYINTDDYEENTILRIRLVNNTLQNGIGGSALDAWNTAFGGITIPITNAGTFNVSTTTTFDVVGQVNVEWIVEIPNTTWLIGSLLSPQILVSTTTTFTVDHLTGLDVAMASTSDILVSSLITGTTTQSVIRCNPTDFDITTCLVSLIIPPTSVLQNDLEQLKNDVLIRFPIGYITRFITILGSTATSSLPVFTATVPNGILGSGSSITLDLNHSLDYILNATTSQYTNETASSTDTFYDITSYYWNILVYMALGFYILRRILGAHIIPKIFTK